MDPDMEFNALTALYQSVVQDIKHSYPAWETVSHRAVKLSQQLRATVNCLSAFVDSVQSVSDYANNLKGASRDVGACVTRVCMRERALETRLRAVADALSDELAVGIQQRTSYWRQRTSDLDKHIAKHVKKVRGRKGRPDLAVLSEQRRLCSQILLEQRTQFSFFISTITPVFHAELGVLDEGPHIRQVIETLEDTVKCVDSNALVSTIVTDLCQGADNAWKQCLSSANQSFRRADDTTSLRAATPDDNDMTPQDTRPHTISAGSRYQHPMISNTSFMPATKPPLQRKMSEKSLTKFSPRSTPTPVPPSLPVSFRKCEGPDRRMERPQSFTGELRSTYQTHSCFATPNYALAGSSCSSSEASSAALIADTLHQIDQLGSDLDSYCTSTSVGIGDSYARPIAATVSKPGTSTVVNGVRIRSESASRPPPPTRRSSAITAATPNAPSVAEARMSMGSMMGSRQSLNSSGVYCGMGSNQDLHYSNVNPYTKHSSHFKL